MSDKNGLLASKWARPHNNISATSAYSPSPSPAAQLNSKVKSSLQATRSKKDLTITTDDRPLTTRFAKGLQASIWAPRSKEQVCFSEEPPKGANPTFIITEPDSDPDDSLHQRELDLESTVGGMFASLNIRDVEMSDAPPAEAFSRYAAGALAKFSLDTSPDQRSHSLRASQYARDEIENIVPHQWIGKRRIRSDNSAELPPKMLKVESRPFTTRIEASRSSKTAKRSEHRRRLRAKESQTKASIHDKPKAVNSNHKHKESRGPAQLRNGQRVGGHANVIGKNSFGHKMMVKMGWTEGESLGKDGTGMLKPVEHFVRAGKAGLGMVHPRGRKAR